MQFRPVRFARYIAVSACYAALDLAGRVTAASGRARLAWLIGGSTAIFAGTAPRYQRPDADRGSVARRFDKFGMTDNH